MGYVHHSGADPAGFSGGGQVGYNWQIGQFVIGLETDLQATSANATFANYQFSNPWFGTVRGRGGIALNNILFYGTLGLAYGRGQLDVAGLRETNLHTGRHCGAPSSWRNARRPPLVLRIERLGNRLLCVRSLRAPRPVGRLLGVDLTRRSGCRQDRP
jgi:hypothetical protein